MSNSKLASVTLISPNKNSPRNKPIDRISIHCFVGQVTAKRGCEVFQPTSKKASCNYVVGYDGSIGLCVDEGDRSWCTSSAANDHRAVTIETASDNKDPYAVTDKAYAALLDLVEDILPPEWEDEAALARRQGQDPGLQTGGRRNGAHRPPLVCQKGLPRPVPPRPAPGDRSGGDPAAGWRLPDLRLRAPPRPRTTSTGCGRPGRTPSPRWGLTRA